MSIVRRRASQTTRGSPRPHCGWAAPAGIVAVERLPVRSSSQRGQDRGEGEMDDQQTGARTRAADERAMRCRAHLIDRVVSLSAAALTSRRIRTPPTSALDRHVELLHAQSTHGASVSLLSAHVQTISESNCARLCVRRVRTVERSECGTSHDDAVRCGAVRCGLRESIRRQRARWSHSPCVSACLRARCLSAPVVRFR